ncbi:uncharacterized protein LOC117591066 [Drosophila guanche]|uniref:Uncharacterized protein n=1 Tax=Drosophila guanche TaxID=7266 RepID=A0A3B0KZM5_DROGU|nr:uncharacterized protein LOC117591066 [Drosophila guanche]SPP89538.1 Hypothetical predicted protein [Drosophila guanche]
MSDRINYFAQSIDSESLKSENPDPDSLIKITHDMVFNLKSDGDVESGAQSHEMDEDSFQETSRWTKRSTVIEKQKLQKEEQEKLGHSPHLMIIFADGDMNSALHFLIESMKHPLESSSVATAFVEQSIRADILERIRPELHPLKKQANTKVRPSYLNTLKVINEIQVEVVSKMDFTAPSRASPILITDCAADEHGVYSDGVIMMHTFKKSMEIINICDRDTKPFGAVSIWNEGMDLCFDIVVAINSSHFFINCTNVDLSPIDKYFKAEDNFTLIEKGFHYEAISIYGKTKTIVFPLVYHIAPKSEANIEEEPSSNSFLES